MFIFYKKWVQKEKSADNKHLPSSKVAPTLIFTSQQHLERIEWHHWHQWHVVWFGFRTDTQKTCVSKSLDYMLIVY